MEENFVLYNCTTGSRAYNLVTPTSDFDNRRIVTPENLHYFFGLKTFEVGNVVTTKEQDNTDYSLRKFAQLIISNNTTALEMLFAPESCHVYVHPFFKEYFIDNRHAFLSSKVYDAIRNYAHAEHRRAMGEITRNLGAERKWDIAQYGYSPKNASHCIRLLYAGITALKTGEFPVWLTGDVREMCYALKTYMIPKNEYIDLYQQVLKDLDVAYLRNKLPDAVNEEFLNDLLVDLYLSLFKDTLGFRIFSVNVGREDHTSPMALAKAFNTAGEKI